MSLTSLLKVWTLGLGLSVCVAGAAIAHNVWLEPDKQGGYRIQFGGHEGKLESFEPSKLQRVQAYDRRGRAVTSDVLSDAQGMRVKPDAKAAMIAVELDNGYFSGVEGGAVMKNLPMDQNPGSTRGVHALKFHKTIIVWNAITKREIGQKFEVTPLQSHAPHAGERMALQVKLDGKPLAGARVSLGEKGKAVLTDSKGLATIKVGKQGTQHIQVIYRQSVQGNPKTTQNSYEALMSFAIHEHH